MWTKFVDCLDYPTTLGCSPHIVSFNSFSTLLYDDMNAQPCGLGPGILLKDLIFQG